MNQSIFYIESCTLQDDEYLTFHELHENINSTGQSKCHECAGGFSYSVQNDYRFIVWRAVGNQLELIEQSLVHKLKGNCKRIFFHNAAIISKVVIYQHNSSALHILLATSSSLYRFILPILTSHQDSMTNSIFSEMNSQDIFKCDPYNSLQMNLQLVEYGTIYVNTTTGDAFFAFTLQNNSLSCVKMPNVPANAFARSQGSMANNAYLPAKFELNQPNIVKRLWSGIIRTGQETQSVMVAYKFFNVGENTYLVSLCREYKLKVWCLKANDYIYAHELTKHVKIDKNVIWNECQIEMANAGEDPVVSVCLATADQFIVCNFRIEVRENSAKITEISKGSIKRSGSLVSISTTRSNVWIVHKNEKDLNEISTVSIEDEADETYSRGSSTKRELIFQNSLLRSSQFREEYADYEDDVDDMEMIALYETELDLKEIYFKLIFEPYKYSRKDICKALKIFRNCALNEAMMPESNDELKEIIATSVEREVQSYANHSNCSEEEFTSIYSKCWSKFYSMLKQYDYDSKAALGLFIDPTNEGLILLIRKASISLFSKADLAQFYHLPRIDNLKSSFYQALFGLEVDRRNFDIAAFLASLRIINEYNVNTQRALLSAVYESDGSVNEIQAPNTNALSTQQYPYSSTALLKGFANLSIINALTDNLIYKNNDFLKTISDKLAKVSELNALPGLFECLLSYLESRNAEKKSRKMYDDENDEGDNEAAMDTDNDFNSAGRGLFVNSEFTLNNLLASFTNSVVRNSELARNICIFINILSRFSDKLGIPREQANEINERYFERSINLLNSFEYLRWLCQIQPLRLDKSKIESNIRKSGDLLELYGAEYDNYTGPNYYDEILLKSFLKSIKNKGNEIFENFKFPNKQTTLSEELMPALVGNLKGYLWPMKERDNLVLLKYFLYNAQYIHINNYCQNTRWIHKTRNLRNFLLAKSALFFDDIEQAIDLFLKASHNLEKDTILLDFLRFKPAHGASAADDQYAAIANTINSGKNSRRSIILQKNMFQKSDAFDDSQLGFSAAKTPRKQAGDVYSESYLLLSYYTKIIHYFDLNGNPEAVIELIDNALLNCHFDSTSRSKLYSILFKSYLDLEYYEKAYHASINADMELESKRTCLKHFIAELCNHNRADKLIEFDYGDMSNEVFTNMYQRAFTSDLRTHDYFVLLYSMHIKNKDYRKAAYCMYLCALRLRQEIVGVKSLMRQERCLLASLNALKIVEKKYAWIVVPREIKDLRHNYTMYDAHDRNELSISGAPQNINNWMIVELEDIKLAHMSLNYTITLLKSTKSQHGSTLNYWTNEELVSMLTKNSFYDDAFIMNNALKNKLSQPSTTVNIFLGLVDRCCKKSDLSADIATEYDLIKLNESFQPSTFPYENPNCYKWKMLHYYLEKYSNLIYYDAVCKRLLTFNQSIPDYIESAFKKINLSSLLNLYVNYGLNEPALDILIEHIDNIYQNKNSKGQLKSLNFFESMLPYTSIDRLLYSLNKSNNKNLVEKTQHLKRRLHLYIDQIKDSTQAIINMTSRR